MSSPSLLLLASVFCTLLVVTSPAAKVSAGKPALPCECFNGGTRTADTWCQCSCPAGSGYVPPYCSFLNTNRVRVGIIYQNVSTKTFSLDFAQQRIHDHFGVDKNKVQWIQRNSVFEANDDSEIAVSYLIEGEIATQLFRDVNQPDGSKPSYLLNPKAIDIWQLGTKVAPASRIAQHLAKGDVLGEHTLPFTFQGKPSVLEIVTGFLEFFIAALVVIVAAPIIEGLLMHYLHPSEEKLDEEVEKYGSDKSKQELAERRDALGRDGSVAAAIGAAAAINPLAPPIPDEMLTLNRTATPQKEDTPNDGHYAFDTMRPGLVPQDNFMDPMAQPHAGSPTQPSTVDVNYGFSPPPPQPGDGVYGGANNNYTY